MADLTSGASAVLETPPPAGAEGTTLSPGLPPSGDSSPSAPAPTSADWYQALPDGLKAHAGVKGFAGKSVTDLVESWVNAQKLVGGSIRLPSDKDTPTERTAKLEKIYDALGRPVSPDKYEITPPGADAKLPWDEQRVDGFKQFAHQLGLTQSQVKGLVEWDMKRQLEAVPDSRAAHDDCLKVLEHGDGEQQGWGAMTNVMLGYSRRAYSTFFPPPVAEKLQASGLANDPAFVRAMAEVGKSLLSPSLVQGEDAGSMKTDVESAQSQLEKLMADPAYHSSDHPGHDAAVSKALSLRRFLVEMGAAG